MARPYNMDQVLEMRGHTAYDNEGDEIGKVDDIYYDNSTREPEWLGVSIGTLMKSHHLVPVDAASLRGEDIEISYAKDFVDDSPEIDSDSISPELEQELYNYYNLRREGFAGYDREAPIDETRGDGQEWATRGDGDSITRHEEEMRVGKREVEGGRVRLHKWVESEQQTENVALRRDRADIERQPINEPAPGAEMRDEDIEVPLTREEPVVEKETFARERIDVDRRQETVDEEVSGEVRKERVDIEEDDDRL